MHAVSSSTFQNHLVSGQFRCKRDATPPFGFRASAQFATQEMARASFTSVSSQILANLSVRSFARSVGRSLARSPAGWLPPVSGVVARRAGSRLNHLLRRTTAPRHHLGPHDVQANRLTRKFRTLLRVFRPTLFSFPLLVTPAAGSFLYLSIRNDVQAQCFLRETIFGVYFFASATLFVQCRKIP